VRAVVRTRYEPPQALRLEELETPTPRKNEVRIHIRATAVTSRDCYVRGMNLTPAYRVMARLESLEAAISYFVAATPDAAY